MFNSSQQQARLASASFARLKCRASPLFCGRGRFFGLCVGPQYRCPRGVNRVGV
jgi:hypothetical protein